MKSKSISIILGCFALLACGGTAPVEQAAEQPQAEAEPEMIIEVDLVDLVANTAEFVGKEISVSGTVDHVCKHGGKRLFIMAEDPQIRFKVEAGEFISAFDATLAGSDITVRGVVKEQKIDDAYLDTQEAGLEAEDSSAEHAEADDHNEQEHKNIESLREQVSDSEDGCISFYSLDCQAIEVEVEVEVVEE